MKQIVNILLCINLLWSPLNSLGQSSNPSDRDSIQIQVAHPSGLAGQDNAVSLLEKRLTQAVVLNGIASTTSRFLLVTDIHELSSQVTTSAPPQYVIELEISCYITDQTEKTVLQQTTFNVKGVARTKAKAYQHAIGSIQARNPKLKTLIKRGKEKITAYYQAQKEE